MTETHDVQLHDLAEYLAGLAREARRAVASGDALKLADILDDVRRRADSATGNKALVLQVAEAFLRAVANSNVTREEKALRRFVAAQGNAATSFLRSATGGRGTAPDSAMRDEVENLIEVGALRRLSAEVIDVRPSLRGFVRDLLDPLPLRLWQRVQDARDRVAYLKLKDAAATVAFAAHVGVSQEHAADHLRRVPIHALTTANGPLHDDVVAAKAPHEGRRPLFQKSGTNQEPAEWWTFRSRQGDPVSPVATPVQASTVPRQTMAN